jgi:isoleucyl-tRNA synthetase
VIVSVRNIRDRKKINLRTPTRAVTVVHRDPEYLSSLEPLVQYIKDELNTLDVVFEQE